MAAFLIQEGMAFNVAPQTTPMPTPDRLAEPTLPPEPAPADYGAQLYWLHCMPCHGDVGQGLTDEFRETYPPEDNNCWARGCHGKYPYEDGFTLPTTVPAIIGPNTLTKFPKVSNLYGFIRAAMPFEYPGSLTEEEYWRITLFLLRENGINFDKDLDASNADQILLPWAQPTPTPTPLPPTLFTSGFAGWPLLVALFILGGIPFLWRALWRKHQP
jgi:cytochrome c